MKVEPRNINLLQYQKPSAQNTQNTQSEADKMKIIEERKKNPELDKMMYDKELAEIQQNHRRTEQLAKKIATGKEITPEEREFLEKNNPEMIKRAEDAKRQAEQLKEKLKNASSKQEAQALIMNSMDRISKIAKYEEVTADIFRSAFSEVVKDYNSGKLDEEKKKEKIA